MHSYQVWLFGCAVHIVFLFHSNQLFKLPFRQNRYAKFFRLVVLRSGIRPYNHIICLLAHRTAHFSAVLPDQRSRLFP